MARLGRSFPIQPYIRRGARPAVSATIALDPVAVAARPRQPVVTANGGVQVTLTPVAATVTVPDPSISTSMAIALAATAATVDVPEITVTVPILPGDNITGDGQIEYNGVLWGGDGSAYQVTDLSGWDDLPAVDDGNVPRASRHGSYPGRKLAQQRDITAVVWLRDDSSTFGLSLDAILAATALADDDTELPLVIRTRGEPRLAYGMVIARTVPTDTIGVGDTKVTVRWICSDPRRYGLTARGLTVAVNATNPTILRNLGNTATHPTIRIPGPCSNPVLTNETLDRTLSFDIDIGDDERLDIDTNLGTVVIGDTSKMSTLSGSSVPVQDFVLGSGNNGVSFDADSGGTSGADFLWRDSWL